MKQGRRVLPIRSSEFYIPIHEKEIHKSQIDQSEYITKPFTKPSPFTFGSNMWRPISIKSIIKSKQDPTG